jgi:Repeat of unknown function (DUF5648)
VALAVATLLALSPAAAWATDVRLVNYAAYAYLGGTADLKTDGVQNFDADSTSKPLRLELWAFSSPYVGGMTGFRLALYSLPPLDPGVEAANVDSGPVPFTPPPTGVWYFSMLLTELDESVSSDDGYAVRDWLNFPNAEYIGVPKPPAKVQAIEFYNPGLDHYFIASNAQEISDLDLGVHPGWWRTGYQFFVWDGAGGDAGPVCRYYIPPGYGDSHFFSASLQECADTGTKFPWLVKESDAAFYIALPDTGTGACAAAEVPIYRMWNGRADSNHRYTTSTAVKDAMLSNGYIAEGYGPQQVAMCAPQ